MAVTKILLRPRCWRIPARHLSSKCFQKRSFNQPAQLDPDDELHPSDAGNSGLFLKRNSTNWIHKHWGFTIYRCTYTDSNAWAYFLSALQRNVRENLEYCGVEEMIDSFDCKVFEDPFALDGASREVVRARFREWIAGPEAQGEALKGESIMSEDGRPCAARYECCVYVDEEVLRSIVDPNTREGYVKLIKAEWPMEVDGMKISRRDHYDHGEEDYEESEEYEAIEGCTLHDVGWMKVHFENLMPGAYAELEWQDWEDFYYRPPHFDSWSTLGY